MNTTDRVHSITYTREGEYVSKVSSPGDRAAVFAHLTRDGYTMLREVVTMTTPDGRQVDVVVVASDAPETKIERAMRLRSELAAMQATVSAAMRELTDGECHAIHRLDDAAMMG
jgi:hypothetical protein